MAEFHILERALELLEIELGKVAVSIALQSTLELFLTKLYTI